MPPEVSSFVAPALAMLVSLFGTFEKLKRNRRSGTMLILLAVLTFVMSIMLAKQNKVEKQQAEKEEKARHQELLAQQKESQRQLDNVTAIQQKFGMRIEALKVRGVDTSDLELLNTRLLKEVAPNGVLPEDDPLTTTIDAISDKLEMLSENLAQNRARTDSRISESEALIRSSLARENARLRSEIASYDARMFELLSGIREALRNGDAQSTREVRQAIRMAVLELSDP